MAVTGRIVHITGQTPRWHEAFFAHARAAFSIDFRRWTEQVGWGPGYRVAALVEEDRIVSTIGVTRMSLSLVQPDFSGQFRRLAEGVQLGCVATVPHRQRGGCGRILMEHVLEEADRRSQAVMLFSGEGASDYYPRFGFRPIASVRYRADRPVTPHAGGEGRTLDPALSRDRDLIRAALAGNPSHGGGLSARADASLLLWHLLNTDVRAICYPSFRSIVFVEEEPDTLHVQEWLGRRPATIEALLPQLATRPARTVELGFVPPPSWLSGGFQPVADPGSRLFLRGLELAGDVPVCFPDLLRT